MSNTLYGPGISKYKNIALRQNKQSILPKKCLRCGVDNFSGKYCVSCRMIVNAEFKLRNKLRREKRRNER